ncbi:MAG TPA: hypothetical protein VG407_13700 [Caulobacteraceae bacterium]|jgi:hypothetical protein|nr:hypothetical protein [Caulobacteraceae bacterium]
MAARLKVFTWSDGFHAHTVATTSRTKALKAWGVNRDLFKDAIAREITAGADYDRAMAEPGVVIERGESIDRGKITALRLPPKTAKTTARKPQAPKGPDPDDVRRVERLKDDLASLEKAHGQERDELDASIGALEKKRRDLERDYARKRTGLKRKLAEAERRLR